jgi:hypothetical protein
MQRGKIPIRRAQLITNFGPGALTITPDGLPLLVASLDEWYNERLGENNQVNPTIFNFEDLRLQSRLGVSFFRLPPDYIKPKPRQPRPANCELPVPAYLFPRWYVCTRCERLKCFQPNDNNSRTYQNLSCHLPAVVNNEEGVCSGRYIPVPLVAVCEHGHIQDFPFRQWVHQSANPQCNLPMKLKGVGGSVEQQQISCDCGATRRLTGVLENDLTANPPTSALTTQLQPGHPFTCRGLKAWAGAVQEPCNNPLVAVLSAGTNVYYSDVRSSIFIPANVQHADRRDVAIQQDVIDRLQTVPIIARLIQGLTPADVEGAWRLIFPQVSGALHNLIEEAILRSHVSYIVRFNLFGQPNGPDNANENDYDEKEFRYEEYQVLSSANGIDSHHLKVEPMTLSENGYMRHYFSKISIVKRLRETRALVGFSRLKTSTPGDANNEAANDAAMSLAQKRRLLWREEPVDVENRWLPGYFVHGEGIFFEIRNDVLNQVATSPAAQQRMNGARSQRILERTPQFVALHTLSHILIKQLCFECGYGATALRERLYCRTENGNPMHGILIYTAQGDAEGAMGGLVRMGTEEILERILRQALEEAKWCSSDPVCRETGSEYGQGIDLLNGAACHSCCHLPETSCECFNSHLDRNVIFSLDGRFRGIFNDNHAQ